MFKRAVCVMVFFSLFCAGLCVRIGMLSAGSAAYAGAASQGVRFDVAEVRGTIYDCNMTPLVNSEFDLIAAAKPSNEALATLEGHISYDEFKAVREKMQRARPVTVKLDSEIGYCPDITVLHCANRYAAQCAEHIIGYIDSTQRGVCGIEKAYDTLLNDGKVEVIARVASDAGGRVLMGEAIGVTNDYAVPKSGPVLTIDKEIQTIAENAMDILGVDTGAVVVIDIASGAIRACVSRPVYSQSSPASSLTDVNSPFINRALTAFSVGSVFKPVVAAAAIDKGIESSFEYTCTGSIELNGVTFRCHKEEGHGKLDMRGAMADSCNTYFINLALKTGGEAIIEKAKALHFGSSTPLADGIVGAAGLLPDAAELDSKAATANLAFGQGKLLATPLQLAAMMTCIANDGIYREPYLIEGTCDSAGKYTANKNNLTVERAISVRTAEIIRGFLEEVVISGSGKRAASEYFTSAGKTATAQTGIFQAGTELCNSWFAGYFPADNPRYAVAIMKENGSGGAVSCAPVFKYISEAIFNAGY